MVAQPEIRIHEPFALESGGDVCPVERAILQGLAGTCSPYVNDPDTPFLDPVQ